MGFDLVGIKARSYCLQLFLASWTFVYFSLIQDRELATCSLNSLFQERDLRLSIACIDTEQWGGGGGGWLFFEEGVSSSGTRVEDNCESPRGCCG